MRRSSGAAVSAPPRERVRLMRGRLGIGTERVVHHSRHGFGVYPAVPAPNRAGGALGLPGEGPPVPRSGDGRRSWQWVPCWQQAADEVDMPIPSVGAERTGETPTTEPAAPPLWHAKPLRRVGDGWLERWMRTTSDLARLQESHPMADAVVDEVDGRLIRIGNRWLVDFASSSYLGFDQEPEIVAAVPEYLAKWGSHPGWSRLVGSPALYLDIEERLKELLGSEDALLLPTISHIHSAVIPVLAGEGTIFLDARAHKTIYDGCTLARSHGATLKRFPHQDVAELERLLRWRTTGPRLICIDGVNSMTGNAPDLAALARL